MLNPRKNESKESLAVIGLDTEAYSDGRCFLICTSLGDSFTLKDFPEFLFSRKYRGSNFVCYNLRYDSGALLQRFPRRVLKELQEHEESEWNGYKIKTIRYKMLSIRKGKNTIHIYDMFGFFQTSLEKAAQTHLGKGKDDMETKSFSRSFVRRNIERLRLYCIRDASLCFELAEILIKTFENFGVYPKKLYSTAYISWQYFRSNCTYCHVKRFWDDYPSLLRASMGAYAGGKFEVTRKGPGNFFEYDIVSAYPAEIANLVDIRDAHIIHEKRYRQDAQYSLIRIWAKLPFGLPSPVPIVQKNVNTYPNGVIEKWVTKTEYDYLSRNHCDISVLDAWHVIVDEIVYPYKFEILRLMERKNHYKKIGDKMRYHTIKIFLNSFYGKMVQLTDKKNGVHAGAAWNPIYAGIVTANVRCRISEFQRQFNSVIAVHTDSIISNKELSIETGDTLGDMTFELQGDGLILGSGIYQIGDKTRLRGFRTKTPLSDILPRTGNKAPMKRIAALSWREVAHRELSLRRVNRFEEIEKSLNLNFDVKRMWLDDWKSYKEVFERTVDSIPLVNL